MTLLVSTVVPLLPEVRSAIDDEAERVGAACGLRLHEVVLT